MIIPTLGRPSLKRVIDEITRDSIGKEIRIIVVADGVSALERVRALSLDSQQVELLVNQHTKGISGSFNTGLSRVQSSEFIFPFSDDDYWKLGKFNDLFGAIGDTPSNETIVISQVLKRTGNKTTFPRVRIGPINSMMAFSYGHPVFFRNSNYVSLTAAVLPSDARFIKFQEEFKLREDLIWLQDLITAGFTISRSACVTAEVLVNYQHTIAREDSEQTKLFLNYLDSVDPDLKKTFLFYHLLRPYAVCGDRDGLKNAYKTFVACEKNKSIKNLASVWFLKLVVNYFNLKGRDEA